jgi:hypothetical protein
METDPVCLRCGRSFHRGMSQGKLANIMGWSFAAFMFLAIQFAVPPSGMSDLLAGAVTTGLFTMGAGVVGMIVGWVVGAFACDH